jgi:hypothetical protein
MAPFGGGGGFAPGGGGGTPDETTAPHIPVKEGNKFVNSPLTVDDLNDLVNSTKKIKTPPGSIQIGQTCNLSASGALPVFQDLSSLRKGQPVLWEYDETGLTQPPFYIDIGPETLEIVQPDFTTSLPFSGTTVTSVPDNRVVNKWQLKTNPSAIIEGLRLRITLQSTSYIIYYYPSEEDWNNNTGADLTADINGNLDVDLLDASLAIEGPDNIEIEYSHDAGVLLGNPALDLYQAIFKQDGPVVYLGETTKQFSRIIKESEIIPTTYFDNLATWEYQADKYKLNAVRSTIFKTTNTVDVVAHIRVVDFDHQDRVYFEDSSIPITSTNPVTWTIPQTATPFPTTPFRISIQGSASSGTVIRSNAIILDEEVR